MEGSLVLGSWKRKWQELRMMRWTTPSYQVTCPEFWLHSFCLFVCFYVGRGIILGWAYVCHSAHVKVRGEPELVLSSHHVCHQGLHSEHWAWQEVLYPLGHLTSPYFLYVFWFKILQFLLFFSMSPWCLLFLPMNTFKQLSDMIVHAPSILLITVNDGLEERLATTQV